MINISFARKFNRHPILILRDGLKTAYCYDIPPFRPQLTLEELRTLRGFSKQQAGTWNRRNNGKNNGSMSLRS